MSNLKLVETPALTPEDHRRRYREAHSDAEKSHRDRVAETEREYASVITGADATRKAAIANAPKVRATLWNGGPGECGCSQAIEAAEAAYRKTVEAADKKRVRTIERSREICGNETSAAKIEFRNSPGWQGFYL